MIEELQVDYRASLICLACAVAFIGTHSAIAMYEQYRLALSTSISSFQKYNLAIFGSLSLGGVAFSGTQYIVFQSIRLRTSDDVVINVEFNPYLLLGSILISSFLILVSILIASKDDYFNKSKTEIMNIFLTRALTKRTIAEIKHLGKRRILFLVCINSLNWIILSGIIAGGSLCLARYIAVSSVSFPGVVEYNMGLLALSIILSFLGMFLLYWLYFRIISVFSNMEILHISCSILGMIFIVFSHYIRILLSKFLYNTEETLPKRYEESGDIFVGILTIAILLSFLFLYLAIWDLRLWLQDTSTQLYQADSALISMLNTANHTDNCTIYTGSTSTIEALFGDSIHGKEAIIYTPELVSYVHKYLLERESLPISLREKISHPTWAYSYSHTNANPSTELVPPVPLSQQPPPLLSPPSLQQTSLPTQYELPILQSSVAINEILEAKEEEEEEKNE